MEKTKVIVSLTSHTRERIQNVPYFLYHSVLKHNYDFVKIVLTLAEEDLKNITPELETIIDNGLIELIVAEHDLKCNLKYFYAMKKYRDLPIITIDDDSIYPSQMIPDLLELHKKYPDVVIARSARKISKGVSYIKWPEAIYGIIQSSFNNDLAGQIRTDLSPEGFGGVLYPPNILEISDSMIPEILKFPRADDIYLTVIEQRHGIKILAPYYPYNKLDLCTKGFDAISVKTDNVLMIDRLVKEYL